MTEIGLKNIKKSFTGDIVLQDITFSINTGEKIGIVGENGGGKTTLFKIIAGLETADEGSITIRKGASIGLLDQIPSYPQDFTGMDVLNTAFGRQLGLKAELQKLETQMGEKQEVDGVLKRYAQVQAQFEALGGYEIEEQRGRIVTGLKLEELLSSQFVTLSGGEKTIICVAKMLLEAPDILLLDEPSNHLDIEAVEWLENYLKDYAGTVLIISHDRYFLDRSVDKIIEIDGGEAEIFFGNYSTYVEERERRLIAQFEAYTDQQKKIKAMEQAIKRFKEWGTQGDNPKFFKKAASLQKQLDKIERLDKPELEKAGIQLNLSSRGRTGNDVLKIEGLWKSYGDKNILKDLSILVRHGEKVAIVGSNGCGKSTLFKLVMGKEQPCNGDIQLGSRTEIGFLEQDISFKDPKITVLEEFRDKCPMAEGQARNILAKFLFFGDDVFKSAATLSGGERSRLRLCQLMYQDINVLILDEPTNHLDIPAREMLEQALMEFDGTLIFVSHDRYFINKLAKRVAELSNGRIINYPGNFDYYRSKQQTQSKTVEKPAPKAKVQKQDKHQSKKVNTFKLQQLENRIEELDEKLALAQKEMEENPTDFKRLEEIQGEIQSLEQKLEKAWEQLEEMSRM